MRKFVEYFLIKWVLQLKSYQIQVSLNIKIGCNLLIEKSWLIYALGGGWGHLNRALSLGRIAAKNRTVTIICNSPYLEYLLSAQTEKYDILPKIEGCYIEFISPRDNLNITRDRIQKILSDRQYQCLIIDTFPRGLGGELVDILPKITAKKILVHRDIKPDYIRAKQLQNFVENYFDLILIPGEIGKLPFSHLPQVKYTSPWLIRCDNELPKLLESYLLLNIKSEEMTLSQSAKIVIISSSGKAEELKYYGKLTQILAEKFTNIIFRCLAAECPENCPRELWLFHWPGIECLLAADLVIAGAGYNTMYECLALGIPLLAMPFKRMYDRQELRIEKCQKLGKVEKIENIETVINGIEKYLKLNYQQKPVIKFINGAIEAVKLIEKTLES